MIIGTGISIGATGDPRASWKGLLLDGIDRIESLGIEAPEILIADRILIEKAFSGAFDLDEILQRAESIIGRLGGVGGAHFAIWLRESVGALKADPNRRQSLDAIAALARCGGIILTTNYDDLLCDATGFEPVTWEEPEKILEVFNRKRRGIVHIHGHWSRPSSIILGRTSYDRIKSAALPQTQLRSFWLLGHWLYLGCGSGGLDDPNLGALLQWARETGLGDSALPDYFLSTSQTIEILPARVGKSTNLVKHTYEDHATDLPRLLEALTPEARASPFQRVGPDARRVRRPNESPLSSPFPSWQEYVDGAVPRLAADEEVIRCIDQHGWAFVLDVASVGKTTLCYRIATRPEYVDRPTYHLLLSQMTVDEMESDISPQAALLRLCRPGVLFVIDDCHHRPELALALWQQWRERPLGSKMVLLATRMERAVNLPGDSSLHDLETHVGNPAVALKPTPQDLDLIANCVLARLTGSAHQALKPPREALEAWHKSFGREIGAFVVAVSECRHTLSAGDFTLPESAGATWIKERHLARFEPPDIENAVCLAVFGQQALELDVPDQCLPHPQRIDRLLRSGLAERASVGGGRFVRYSLREPGWGQLILAAVDVPPEQLPLMAESARKKLVFALVVGSRLYRSKRQEGLGLYWQELARAFATQPEDLAEAGFNTQLHFLAAFLNTAQQQGQGDLAKALWRALDAQPERLAERAFETSLDLTAAFLNTAQQQGQGDLAKALWRAIAAQPERLAERAFETSLDLTATFLNTAQQQGQAGLANALWRTLAAQPERLAERASKSPLNSLATFLDVAGRQGHAILIEKLGEQLAAQPDRLVEQAFASTLNDLAAFLDAAEKQGLHTLLKMLSLALAEHVSRLAERAFSEPLNDVGAFFATVLSQGRDDLAKRLWAALAAQPNRLASHASTHRPNKLMSFLSLAPDELKKAIIQRLKMEDWAYGPYRSQRLSSGGPGLAIQFGLNEREDLKIALINNIIRRKDPSDFDYRKSALIELSRLVSQTTPEQDDDLIDLLRTVCAGPLLSSAYKSTSSLGLAGALHTIALHQRPSAIRLFWHPALGSRLRRELVDFARFDDQGRSATIELLGASQLVGWRVNRTLLQNVTPDLVGEIPHHMPHRAEARTVEQWQRQAWLGLRVVASTGPGPLYVDPVAVTETLELWRNNIVGVDDQPGTNEAPGATAHRINVSMVQWLERCAQTKTGQLLPNREPLWRLAGFPPDPRSL
ncbi:SIR2 family protein [Phenylobacterium sp.]|uniref:SIR2 family protein n=1 Tax=Phenylobacterium sp. TaxID=1871053 RepID=UPI002FC8BC17